MVKYAALVLPIVALIVAFIAFRILVLGKTPSSPALSSTSSLTDQEKSADKNATSLTSDQERIRSLEEVVATLIQRVNTINAGGGTGQNSSSPLTEDRLKKLETAVNDLKDRITKLELTPTPAQATTKSPPLYIPLGSSSRYYNDGSWINVDAIQVKINPADYPGYSTMQLEGQLRLSQKQGTVAVRLFNSTDNSSVVSAQISTDADSLTWVTSSGFTLPSGSKTYTLQIYSSSLQDGAVRDARIKVNF